MKRIVLIMLLTVLTSVIISGQTTEKVQQNDKIAQELGRFESNWLMAGLNRDESWLERFSADKLNVSPPPTSTDRMLQNRTREIADAIDSAMPDGSAAEREIKVRITGNITILGRSAAENSESSAAGNRAYYFLDTFNKRGGKWQVIASHFSRVAEPAAENAEQTVRQLEREWNVAKVKKDVAELNRITADDFAGVESSGRIIDKAQVVNNIEFGYRDVQTGAPEDLKVRFFGDTAIVTGRVSAAVQKKDGKSDLRLFFTDVWAKRDGRWQLINYQATRLPQSLTN